MPHSVDCTFAADHPTASGHFPGNPVIPGALLLSEVIRAIEQQQGQGFARFEIATAKFLQPVRPGDTVAITWDATAAESIAFACRVPPSDRPVLTGTLRRRAAAS